MMNGNKSEIRIQNSVLNNTEKKVLIWIAEKLPKRINSDHLTGIGFAGALISSVGYMLSNRDLNFLWIASFGLVVNWFGDSLDGTLARVRNAQRPIYGFFIDHNFDALTILVICIGAGLSPLISFSVAMLVLAGYLLLSIFTYLNTYLNGEFRITYMKLGPTEFRIIVILINTAFIYIPINNLIFRFMGITLGMTDAIGMMIAIILFLIYLVSFAVNREKYKKIDPPHHSTKNQ
ncbi:MAG: CDP-alcohol phosphatidyltransferase family protein [Bacteroidales bacterium]